MFCCQHTRRDFFPMYNVKDLHVFLKKYKLIESDSLLLYQVATNTTSRNRNLNRWFFKLTTTYFVGIIPTIIFTITLPFIGYTMFIGALEGHAFNVYCATQNFIRTIKTIYFVITDAIFGYTKPIWTLPLIFCAGTWNLIKTQFNCF